jgi:uncharacterized protein (DUF885 family)
MIDRRALMVSTAALTLAGCAARTPSKPLADLFKAFGDEVLDLSPEATTSFGLDKDKRAAQKAQLDDRSLARRDRNAAINADQLKRLRAIKRKDLTGMDAVNYDVLDFELALAVESDKALSWGDGTGAPYVISQQDGAYQSLPDFLDSQHSIETTADAEAYVSRLDAFPKALDSEVERARFDMAKGVIAPDFILDKALTQLKQLRDQPAAKAGLVQSLVRRAKEKRLTGDWEKRATAIYEGAIQPALDRQIALVKEMRAKATHEAGVWRLPDGENYYRLSLESQTSTKLTPAEIHQTGLDLVASYSSRMDAIFKSQGMSEGTTGERLRALYANPKFRYPNTVEGKAKLIADLNLKIAAIQARLPQYFGVLPKTKVTIKAVPKETELGAAGGYYQAATLDGSRPGAFYINLRDTAEQPSFVLPTLVYHEAIPGHHMQISIQQEQPLPFIRQTLGFNAYVEGWALYCEQLADEMSVYTDDPFGQIGYLHDALFRAVRLVVDTGMHAMKWSREQALRYYMDAIGDPEAAAVTEIERYCASPGQACGYMVGKLAWLKNREKAKQALGAKFDIRKFHDAGLTPGAMPLAVLDKVIDDYIAAAKKA